MPTYLVVYRRVVPGTQTSQGRLGERRMKYVGNASVQYCEGRAPYDLRAKAQGVDPNTWSIQNPYGPSWLVSREQARLTD